MNDVEFARREAERTVLEPRRKRMKAAMRKLPKIPKSMTYDLIISKIVNGGR